MGLNNVGQAFNTFKQQGMPFIAGTVLNAGEEGLSVQMATQSSPSSTVVVAGLPLLANITIGNSNTSSGLNPSTINAVYDAVNLNGIFLQSSASVQKIGEEVIYIPNGAVTEIATTGSRIETFLPFKESDITATIPLLIDVKYNPATFLYEIVTTVTDPVTPTIRLKVMSNKSDGLRYQQVDATGYKGLIDCVGLVVKFI